MILPHVSYELRVFALCLAVTLCVYTYALFREDNRQVCPCGCEEWDSWAECETCHGCGRVRG